MSCTRNPENIRLSVPLPIARAQSRRSNPVPDHTTSHHRCHSQASSKPNISRIPSTAHSNAPTATSGSPRAWRGLFHFTTQKHLPVLIVALICAICTGAITPVQSWLMGKLFTSFANFGSGQIDGPKFKHDLARYNTYFIILGAGQWFFSASMYANWMMFGDLQARSARDRIYNALVDRDIEWFDRRKDGVSALTTRLQGFVLPKA
jgi:ATP-binding cassette subfamily B (MDR/TAP) protein 1